MMKMRGTSLFMPAFVLCFLLLLAGCGAGHDAAATSGTEPESESMPDEDDIVIGISQVGSESDWRTTNTKAYINTFTQEKGYYLIFEDGQQKQENQVKAVRKFILKGVDYIVLAPIVETGWDAVLKEARDAGIPVIIVDRNVSVEDESLYTCRVGSDLMQEGRNAGEWLADYLESRGRRNKKINIVTLQGTLGSTAQIGWTSGFAEVMEKHPNWNMLEYQSGDFTQAKAYEVMEYFLEKYDDIDVVICENDNMAFGAIEAIKEAGLKLGKNGDIILISFDAVRDALLLVQKGEIMADFECNPIIGPLVEETLQKLERGEPVEKVQYIDETYFDYRMDIESLLEEREY